MFVKVVVTFFLKGSEGSETEESTEVFPKDESDEEIELPDSESEFENLRSEDQEHELEPEYQSSEEEEPHEPILTRVVTIEKAPEREVTFTPLRSTSKNAKRNMRRRQLKKTQRNQEQYNANKRKIDIKERLWSKRKHPRLRIGTQSSTPQRAPTSSTEIMSDTDARADPRPAKHHDQLKRRRESQESVEELVLPGQKSAHK